MAAQEVKIGVPSWTGVHAIAHVLCKAVTMRIGGQVEYVPANTATIFRAMANTLGDRSPAIADVFSNFALNARDVSGLAFEISANGRDPAEVAAEGVNANSDRVDRWLRL